MKLLSRKTKLKLQGLLKNEKTRIIRRLKSKAFFVFFAIFFAYFLLLKYGPSNVPRINPTVLICVVLAFLALNLRQTERANITVSIQKEKLAKQNELIRKQKRLVEEKNREVTESITYAKRLQDAILPPIALIQKYLPQSFVLYKPKDIVAGDFYWMEAAPLNPPNGGTSVEQKEIEPDYHSADPFLYESLKERSQEFRKQPTEAEIAAWSLLKSNSTGFHIRRQYIIGQYIVDFVNIKTKTIIEIDGDIHNYQKEEDQQRTNWLKKNGYEVVRYKNEEVLRNSENFVLSVQNKLKEREELVSKILPDGEDIGGAILIAACDCTGHGVPGAMVSVVCSNALNQAVKEFKITEPGKILDKVRELVLETFSHRDTIGEKGESAVQDGMDISLCSISTLPTEEGSGLRLQWSGAYNPLWIIKAPSNGEDLGGATIIEIAADKQPIGKTDKPTPFTTHTLNLTKGDTLYLFTDGYADQFGGPKGKKLKYKPFQQMLLSLAGLPMQEQAKRLDSSFNEWKGKLDQVDDVLIIGIRV